MGPLDGLDVVILAGGRGTRLAALGLGCQKTVADVGGRPFLLRLLDRLAAEGAARAVLAVGHRSEDVRRVVSRRRGAPEIVLSEEARPLGTGGALALARRHVRSSPVVVMNGDTWAPVDLGRLLAAHRTRRAPITLAVAPRADLRDVGCVEVSADGRVRRFEEKAQAPGGGHASAGVYVFEAAALAALGEPRPCSLERAVLAGAAGRGLHAVVFDAPFLDIGSPEAYLGAGRWFTEGPP